MNFNRRELLKAGAAVSLVAGFPRRAMAQTASMRLDCLDPDSFRYTITSKGLTAA
jgi:hypothetical protein